MQVFKFFIEILVLFIYSNFFICSMCCDVLMRFLSEKGALWGVIKDKLNSLLGLFLRERNYEERYPSKILYNKSGMCMWE